MRSLTVTLTPQQQARMQGAIQRGQHVSEEEIVHEALRLWEEREDKRGIEMDQLRQAHSFGKVSGEGVDIDPMALVRGLRTARARRG